MSIENAAKEEVAESKPLTRLSMVIDLKGEVGGDFTVTVRQKVGDNEERSEIHSHTGITSVFSAIDDAADYLQGMETTLALSALKALDKATSGERLIAEILASAQGDLV